MNAFLFILYVVLSTIVVLGFFLWALKSGQFREQERARYLPLLLEEPKPPLPVSRPHRSRASVFAGLLIAVLVVGGFLVAYMLMRSH